MPKPVKVILIVAGVALTLGVILVCVATVFGGARFVSVNWRNGWRVYDNDSYGSVYMQEFNYDYDKPANSLDIAVDACELHFQNGDKFSIYGEFDPAYWDLSIDEGGTDMTVRLTAKPSLPYRLEVMDFGFGDYRTAKLWITYPRNTDFETVNVTCNAAAVDLGALSCRELDLSFNAVKADCSSISCERLYLTINAGSVSFSKVNVGTSADITLNAGNLDLTNCEIRNLDYLLAAGASTYSGTLLGNNAFDVSAGSLKLDLAQSRDDLRFDCSVGLGDLSIDGTRITGFGVNDSMGPSSARVYIDLNVQMGSVIVNTRR
ncbi:MAG: DUF4097 domain-containing protein [Coriobacteriia bacterium]|nr:DUF4097 domain-containing protein [Coriobacteriia bacterium]